MSATGNPYDNTFDTEELINGLGSQLLKPKTSKIGNHMARKTKRWNILEPTDNEAILQSSTTKTPISLNYINKDLVLENDNARIWNQQKHNKKWESGKDGVHKEQKESAISPGQLYSTESGRLFHAGKILIVLVGLPATSKTMLSVAITRYTRWLGVKTQAFHVSEYRRQKNYDSIPDDYFRALPTSNAGLKMRRDIINKCINDLINFFVESKGQLAIYDALNILSQERKEISDKFKEMNIKVLFIESVVNDPKLLEHNVEMAVCSPDYKNWNKQEAKKDYMNRININKPLYKEMTSKEDLSFVKYINFGEKLMVNHNNYGYLINKIVFFLMNLKEKKGKVYFSRCGTSDNDKYIDDEVLNDEGVAYSKALTELVLKRINLNRMEKNSSNTDCSDTGNTIGSGTNSSGSSVISTNSSLSLPLNQFSTNPVEVDAASSNTRSREHTPLIPTAATLNRSISEGKAEFKQLPYGDGSDEDSFVVWTAPRKRTYDTAKFFQNMGIKVRIRSQLQQLHPGLVADMKDEEIKEKFPNEYKEHLRDPYHHRYPRAESYHDLAVRMEPLLLEMERMCGDILIIGHETTLRVLYGYLMASSSFEIPTLDFTRDELIEISFGPYENKVKRIPIDFAVGH
ncbi:bifunctional fructose-2,6-bisphosphate 2-phosphatase/6-phosphofructo-2-kinase SCDLUD_000655 [Saccharomycodes ludwigii]|uniref:bifunctional fructose-2,6-bisphosphate 2-phosphatase/6-phosphofructo-2-kinase n=1 Tax=Saccharomycodes ludwigii TaxID=36035 RepID=UPI001E8332B9|nr:hypothetical protein SCDLUD_000655 [Saccharomycodes ludwigii]KAH3903045.1 hypothetical protein SCDLUD_000655 [Saccharomycodes ludwigii]